MAEPSWPMAGQPQDVAEMAAPVLCLEPQRAQKRLLQQSANGSRATKAWRNLISEQSGGAVLTGPGRRSGGILRGGNGRNKNGSIPPPVGRRSTRENG